MNINAQQGQESPFDVPSIITNVRAVVSGESAPTKIIELQEDWAFHLNLQTAGLPSKILTGKLLIRASLEPYFPASTQDMRGEVILDLQPSFYAADSHLVEIPFPGNRIPAGIYGSIIQVFHLDPYGRSESVQESMEGPILQFLGKVERRMQSLAITLELSAPAPTPAPSTIIPEKQDLVARVYIHSTSGPRRLRGNWRASLYYESLGPGSEGTLADATIPVQPGDDPNGYGPIEIPVPSVLNFLGKGRTWGISVTVENIDPSGEIQAFGFTEDLVLGVSESGEIAIGEQKTAWTEQRKELVAPPERFANYELYNLGKNGEQHSQLSGNKALKVEHWYELQVWISTEVAGKPIGDKQGQRQPIRDPKNTEIVTIYVLFEPDPTYFEFNENERVQILELPPASKGDSTEATLRIRPKQKTLSENVLAEVGVRFYYNFSEIESMKIIAEVVGRDEDPPHSRFGLEKPIDATYRKLGDWKSLDEIQRREMHIAVRSLGNDRYEITFLYENVEFKGALRLTKEEVEDIILQARDLLEYLAVNPESPIIRKHPHRLRELVRKLGEIGRLLWSKVFHAERNKSLWHIGQLLKEHPLKRDGIIQVVVEDNAAGFVFPWNLLYDGPVLQDMKTPLEDILEGFWGMRYCIEQFYGSIRNSWSGRPVQVDQELQLSFMLLQQLPSADQQQQFINGLRERSQQRINVGEPITDATNCYNLLKNCDSHILYFYTRGYTRRRQADLAVQPDLKRGEHGEPEPEKSYIELSKEKLYLQLLEVNKDLINLRQRPIVLLNMCEGAQITPSLSEGFIPFFLDQQASAVISTECPMTARFAHPFAIAFFDELLSGDSLGTALLKARRKFVQPDELMAPLGLAYTLYGMANVRYSPPPLGRETITLDR